MRAGQERVEMEADLARPFILDRKLICEGPEVSQDSLSSETILCRG